MGRIRMPVRSVTGQLSTGQARQTERAGHIEQIPQSSLGQSSCSHITGTVVIVQGHKHIRCTHIPPWMPHRWRHHNHRSAGITTLAVTTPASAGEAAQMVTSPASSAEDDTPTVTFPARSFEGATPTVTSPDLFCILSVFVEPTKPVSTQIRDPVPAPGFRFRFNLQQGRSRVPHRR